MNLKGAWENSTRRHFRRGEEEEAALCGFYILEELAPHDTSHRYAKRQQSFWPGQASFPSESVSGDPPAGGQIQPP